MPQFLLKRIQALKAYSDVEIFVYEWTQTSKNYTVQREQIKNLIPQTQIVSGAGHAPDLLLSKLAKIINPK